MKQRSSKSLVQFGAVLLAVGCGMPVLATPAAAQDAKRLGGAVTTAPLQNAPATSTARKPLGGTVRIPAGATMVALTAAECTTLGGETVSEAVCNSGKACQTTTQDGDWKRVCLSKAE